MNVVLISNYQPDAQQSMLRYPEMLRRVLAEREIDVRVVHPPAVLGRWVGTTRQGPGKWIGYIDKYVLGRFWLRRQCRGADLVHVCDHSNAMYLDCAGRIPRLITCHDLLAIQAAGGEHAGVTVRGTGQRLQRWILKSLRTAPYVVCASRKTADDLQQLAPEIGERWTVIHHALNWSRPPGPPQDAREILRGLGTQPDRPYFLHVGGNQWYKNRLGAIRIFEALRRLPEFRDSQFVMAGAQFTRPMREQVRSAGLDDVVVEAGRVPDETLQSLYRGALALLFPSLQEGFGWPIPEAQACGCLVITTDRPPMTEVAGGAAILIDPEDPARAAEAIAAQWPHRQELIARGLENAGKFSTERMASAYCAAYEEALRLQRRPVSGTGT